MNKDKIIKGIFLFALAVCAIPVFAQSNRLKFEQVLPDPDVNHSFNGFLFDSQGYLWISSGNGLYKYSGYNAKRYQFDPFDPHSVSQNIIYTFWIDKKDTIWLGTPEGLCKFDRKTEKFTRYDTSLIPGMPDLANVSAINEDAQGNLWIGNFEGRLWRYNREKGEFLSLTSKLNFQKEKSLSSVFHDAIYFITKDRTGKIWVGNNNGLHLLNLNEKDTGENGISFMHYQHNHSDTNSISFNEVLCMLQDHTGMYWIGTVGGLNSLDIKSGKFTRYLADARSPLRISNNAVRDIVEDNNGNLWIATENGLNRFNKERTKISYWFENPTGPSGLKAGWLTSLGLDAGGNLFVSSSGGLQSVVLNQKAFGLLRNDPADLNSISNNQITAIAEDVRKNIWIGTFGGGLDKWEKETGKFTHYQKNPKNPISLRSNEIGAILTDSGSNIWVCNNEYLSKLNSGTGAFEHYNSNARNLESEDAKKLYSICRDHNGLIWLGTGNGIKSFDPVTKKFNHYFYEAGNPYGISDYTAIFIFADSQDYIWVGTNSIAFNRFDKKTGRFIHYKNNSLDSTSISSNLVNCIYEDSKGNLWIGTIGGGLCQYNYETDNFTTHSRNKDIPWNTVFSIQEDKAGNIWLGTDKGLSCYLVSQKKFINYDDKDGLQDNFFGAGYRYTGSSLKGADGVLYFGGVNGLNYFNPEQIHPNSYVPPIVITEFKIFDKLQPGKNEAEEILLNYSQKIFSFEFAALNYSNNSKNRYAYQLEGFDPEWIYCGSRRYVGYTSLSPGHYVFKVKGSNNDGIWNEKGISIKLTILPPWWRTWWAYTIYGLIFIAGVFMVDRVQRKRLIEKQRQASREKELAQAKEIEKAYHQLKETQTQLIHAEKMASLGELTAGIAHEIQNPLNFVNNFSDVNTELIDEASRAIRQNNPDEAQTILTSLKDNEEKIKHHGQRADAIVKSMLQHSRTNKGQKEMVNLNAMADEYLRLAYHGFRYKDKNFNVTMQTEYDENIREVNIIPQDIGRVLLNLYNNAFYAVSAKSLVTGPEYAPTITVTTKLLNGSPFSGTESAIRNPQSVILSVKDNGPGIPEKIREKIFQPFFTTKPTGEGTGLGLSMSYDIIKAHGGTFKVESKENEGAEFIIQLPLS